MFARFTHRLHARTLLIVGGLGASVVLLGFGVGAAAIGYQGIQEVRSTLRDENIVAPADSTIPGQLVDTGSEAKAQADIMRHHQLESSQGLTYAEMGRFATADSNPKGTNDAKLALLDANGQPVANAVRTSWVTETALTTALKTSYFAEQVGYFSIVMGFALMLTGVGFVVLTLGALAHQSVSAEETEKKAAVTGPMVSIRGK